MSSEENVQNGSNKPSETYETGFRSAALYLLNHKRDCVMWSSRVATMMFTVSFIFPFLSGSPYSFYYKALMANSVTSIIRLNQRMPPFQFSKEYLGLLLLEDSCHYILYTLIFFYTYPFTLVLLPIFLFAFLHSTNFTLRVFEILGWRRGHISNSLSKVAIEHSKSILRLVAYTEIFLMPFNVCMILIGKGSLLTPIIYYRFLTLRYQSRRNPYTRAVFHDLRVLIEVMASQPAVPLKLRWLCHKFIELVSRLAPPVTSVN